MEEKQFYAAIDLGTTNSVIAYGNMIRNKMKPIVLDLDRKNEIGSTSRHPLLPSVVSYYKSKDGSMMADVGDYAKSRYGLYAGYVCKSVKSLMGMTDQVPLVEEIPDKTPADVSGQILSYMIQGARKKLFQSELRDVIITVPASFDSDQCQATIDAARKAGIAVEKENIHEILLYEPKAVIYDFMRMQEDGEIPSDLLSLETDKNVLVFDLGGGTLDVTIHRVGYRQEGILNIQDLAISRYTLLGGDNFDELLAADMLERFEEYWGIKVANNRREEVMCKLRKLAEQLKVELSLAYENARMSGIELPDDYGHEVMDINLFDAYSYEDTYTKERIEKILSPLMGYGYKKEDAARIQRMNERDVNNIIYPVLDVLDKAGSNIKIDAVILNGGMTKFYLIRQRLKEFFGFEPLETSDPDLAVARGAVYYHYCLHKYNVGKIDETKGDMGNPLDSQNENTASEEMPSIYRSAFNTSTILNDSINLGLRGEYVSLLIPAGTELPYRSEEIRDKYKLDKTTDTIGIEIFLGRGKTKNLPNRRIATRVVKLKNSYPINTPISFQIYIDSLRRMRMEAWITGKPDTKAVMDMDMASLKGAKRSTKGIGTTEKLHLNPKSEMNELEALAKRNKNMQGHELNRQITERLEVIGQADNPEDFFEPCMEIVNGRLQSDMMVGYMYTIAVYFQEGWNESQKRRMLKAAKRHFEPFASFTQNSYVRRKALELIAILEPDFADFCRNYLTRASGENEQFKQVILQFIIRYEKDELKAVEFLKDFLKGTDVNKWMAQALIQRYGRGTPKENQKHLVKLVKTIADSLSAQDKESIPSYLVVLLAELCSNDTENSLRADSYTMKHVWRAIQNYLSDSEEGMLASAVTAIWEGTILTQEEEDLINSIV